MSQKTPLEGQHILITGGAGFIGAHLTERLAKKNRVRVLDSFFRDAISKTGLADLDQVEIVQGDVCQVEDVRRAMEGVTHVVHLASIAGVDTVLKNPVRTMQVAILGTYHVLEEALRCSSSIERLIDFSTSEVFGEYAYKVAEGNVTSLGAVGEARWTYAVSKLATEHLAHNYYAQYQLPTCSIRPFNIFGPNQIGEGAIHQFVARAIRNEPLTIHNDGDQIRSWCYIDDIVDGVELCLQNPKAIGQAFNIGNPRNTVTIHHLAKAVVRIAGSQSPIQYKEWKHTDVELRIPNIDKARTLLGYQPQFDLEEGLDRTIHWYRSRT